MLHAVVTVVGITACLFLTIAVGAAVFIGLAAGATYVAARREEEKTPAWKKQR